MLKTASRVPAVGAARRSPMEYLVSTSSLNQGGVGTMAGFIINILILFAVVVGALVISRHRGFNILFGLFLSGFGLWALVTKRMPSRGLPDLEGTEAMIAGIIAVVGGIVLMAVKPRRK